MLAAEVRPVMNGRICSHCAKHTHFSHPVSHSFTFHPHTRAQHHCTTPAFLIFPPSALPDSPWNLEVTGVRRAAGFQKGGGRAGGVGEWVGELQVATSENLPEPPTAHQHAAGKGASGKGYHGNTIQCIIKEWELQLGIHPCTVLSPAAIWYSARAQGR